MMEDWVECQLGDVIDIISGKNQKQVISPNGPFPIFGSGGVIGKATQYLCNEGTTIIGRKGTINSPIFVTEKFWNVDTAFGLSPTKGILPKLLYYFCIGFNFKKLDKSTTIPSLAKRDLLKIEIVLPPLPIQRAIVARIEELFSSLDQGIADLQRAQEQLRVYRQAVLKKAFEGELTREWREQQTDLPSAEELLEQIQEERQRYYEQQVAEWEAAVAEWEAEGKVGKKPRKPRVIKDNFDLKEKQLEKLPRIPGPWQWIKSGKLFQTVTSGSRGWAKYYTESGSIFIRITNLEFNSLEVDLEPSKVQYVNPPVNTEGIRTKVQKGDLLFSITGYLGMFAIAPDLDSAFVNQHIALARPIHCFNLRYLGYWIISKAGGNYYINLKDKGATKSGLTLEDIKTFPVPFPSNAEQHRVVQEIESRLSICDQVEANTQESLAKAEALRQSILKKAFEGKLLTAAEIAACKQEADYEPAGVLLERIRTEKKK